MWYPFGNSNMDWLVSGSMSAPAAGLQLLFVHVDYGDYRVFINLKLG